MVIHACSLRIVTILLLALTIVSCSDDSSSNSTTGPSTTLHPFAGNWNVVFAGDFVDEGTFKIKADGSFSWVIVVPAGADVATNTMAGNVSTSGSLSGNIYYSGSEIGTITGTFSGNAGSGAWSTNVPTSGSWSATR